MCCVAIRYKKKIAEFAYKRREGPSSWVFSQRNQNMLINQKKFGTNQGKCLQQRNTIVIHFYFLNGKQRRGESRFTGMKLNFPTATTAISLFQ
jgi:hypothetical protein